VYDGLLWCLAKGDAARERLAMLHGLLNAKNRPKKLREPHKKYPEPHTGYPEPHKNSSEPHTDSSEPHKNSSEPQ
jgi:hypothetical protein